MTFEPSKPHMRMRVKTPDGQTGTVGSAWVRDDGSLLVKLHAGVTLSWNDGMIISLFPATNTKEKP